MNITASENELFKSWGSIRQGFVADGVIDENAYIQSVITSYSIHYTKLYDVF